MIYTSYFAQMRNFPVNFIPIAICGGIPKWYNGLWYKKVAPKWAFFSQWKQTHDDEYYVEHFNREVLQPHEPQRFLNEIQLLVPEEIRAGMAEPVWQSKNVHVVLLCYEKRGDFCHRHLVSKWVNDWAGKDLIQEWIPEAVEERVITEDEYQKAKQSFANGGEDGTIEQSERDTEIPEDSASTDCGGHQVDSHSDETGGVFDGSIGFVAGDN
jgi:hypothetical protein